MERHQAVERTRLTLAMFPTLDNPGRTIESP